MNILISVLDGANGLSLKTSLERCEEVSSVKNIENPDIFFRTVKRLKPSCMIFSLEDRDIDVLEVLIELKAIRLKNESMNIIIVIDKKIEFLEPHADMFGIDYVFFYPYDNESIVERVINFDYDSRNISIENKGMSMEEKRADIERIVSTILNRTGIMPNLKGYKYLKEAIVLGCMESECLESVTNYLYPKVAENNNTNVQRVERSIRHAIATAWKRDKSNDFFVTLGFCDIFKDKKPTNSEYIFAVVDYIRNLSI